MLWLFNGTIRDFTGDSASSINYNESKSWYGKASCKNKWTCEVIPHCTINEII